MPPSPPAATRVAAVQGSDLGRDPVVQEPNNGLLCLRLLLINSTFFCDDNDEDDDAFTALNFRMGGANLQAAFYHVL